MGVLTELKNRGVQDILIACMDGLSGFPEAVRAVYPQTRVQLCIVHMVRNATKFVSYKDLKKICADLKAVYSAATEEAGRAALEDFGEIWNFKYPMIYQSCVYYGKLVQGFRRLLCVSSVNAVRRVRHECARKQPGKTS